MKSKITFILALAAMVVLAAGVAWAQMTVTYPGNSLTTPTGAYQSAVQAYPHKWDLIKGDLTIEGSVDYGGIQARGNTWDGNTTDDDDWFGVWTQIGLARNPVFNSSDGVWMVSVQWTGGGDDLDTQIREILHMQEEPGTQPMPKLYTDPRTIAGGDGDDTYDFKLQIHSTGATTGWAKLWINGDQIKGDMWSVFTPEEMTYGGEDLSSAQVLVGVMSGNNPNNPEHIFSWSDLTVTGYPACVDEVWVDDDWAGTIPGSEVEPGKFFGFNAFDNIQDGIDAVCGSTVNVAAGTYNENVDIDNPLALLGEDGAILDGTGLGGVGINIDCGNVTVDNFEVRNFGDGIHVYVGSDYSTDWTNIHLTNNVIHDFDATGSVHGFGIYIGTESERFNPSSPWYDPSLTDHLDFTGLEVRGNTIYNTLQAALVLQSFKATTGTIDVKENEIYGTSYSSIWVDSACDIKVENNNLYNSGNVVFISSYSDGYYEGNPNQQFDSKNIEITGNTIANNTSNGVVVYDGWPATFSVNYNSITGNGSMGVYNWVGGGVVDATCNWWGDASGPYHPPLNSLAIGDEVSDDVDFEPWLNAEVGGPGDLNDNGCVDRTDYYIIVADIRGPEPHNLAHDLNGDGRVNIADARYLVTLFTNPRGASCDCE